jgi:hypothetical protein
MEAADGCEYCGAKKEIMVLDVDESGDFGDIQVRCRHAEGCLEEESESFDISGWVFSHEVLKIVGREFPTLRTRVNVGPCFNCWKLIAGVPIILFPENGEYEVDFCDVCVKELGILEAMLR